MAKSVPIFLNSPFYAFVRHWYSRSKMTSLLKIVHKSCIITKYWIRSFCQLVFFQLAQVLSFFLELIDHRPHSSELMHLSFWIKKTLFLDNSGNVHSKTEAYKLKTIRFTNNQFQKLYILLVHAFPGNQTQDPALYLSYRNVLIFVHMRVCCLYYYIICVKVCVFVCFVYVCMYFACECVPHSAADSN